MDLLTMAFNAAASGAFYIGMAVTAFAAFKGTLFNNNQNQETLITRFGKHVKTVKAPGLAWKIPFLDKIAARISTSQNQEEETLKTKTKDDLFVELPITIQYDINDSGKFYFQNRNAIANLRKVVSAAVRTAASAKDFQELNGDRDGISNTVIAHIKDTADEFGINIRRIVIDQPKAPQAVEQAFNEVRASERLMEAARNKAGAHKIETVTKAEAEKEADKLRGEGKAEFRRAIFNQYSDQINKLVEAGVPREEAVDVMMGAMKQDTLREVGDRGNLIIVTDGNSGAGNRIAELQTLGRAPYPAGEQNNKPRPPAASQPA